MHRVIVHRVIVHRVIVHRVIVISAKSNLAICFDSSA